VADVVRLACELVRIPSVTNCPDERLAEVGRCARLVVRELEDAGCEVRFYDRGRYPAVVAGFPGGLLAPVTLAGHFDVVQPSPDDRQFDARVEGDRLWGRGSADMKTVVASQIVWMREARRLGPPYPPVNLLLVGNEENGETEPFGTPHVLADLGQEHGWRPELMVVGERTGEGGRELFGAVCPANRGIARLRITARGRQAHTGTDAAPADLVDRMIEARAALGEVFGRRLTLGSADGWETTARVPFLTVGYPDVFNISAGEGSLGIELRPIPEDDLEGCVAEVRSLCEARGLEVTALLMEPGISCPPENPHLGRLLDAVAAVSGGRVPVGRKKPGSSARFAPGGNAVVWGQSGHGPHSPDEWHYIPSIGPYLEVLDDFARRTAAAVGAPE
jgi:succinyl-diaminopimelate desuccinylase